MTTIDAKWHKYRYFPYERRLAKLEVRSLFGVTPQARREGVRFEANRISRARIVAKIRRLTYFREGMLHNGPTVVTDQARLEASINHDGNGRARQATRYSAHGLHEYRGKFNPQIVRAIGNVTNLDIGAWVLDPFCGSGTTLLEGAHIGWNVLGADLNPLAALIANAKIVAFKVDRADLLGTTRDLIQRLECRIAGLSWTEAWTPRAIRLLAGEDWEVAMPNYRYLSSWFSQSVLAQLSIILASIDLIPTPSLAPVYKAALSDILRQVSQQDPRDLRMRRRKRPAPNEAAIPIFIHTLKQKLGKIARAQESLSPLKESCQHALHADSRQSLEWLRAYTDGGSLDAIITSPPYATALPYIDTQRLSLCLLGLVQSSDLNDLEYSLVGSREITKTSRRRLEEEILGADATLPGSVKRLTLRLLKATDDPAAGFRKVNMPALIYRYFIDAGQVFRQTSRVARGDAWFAMVVGPNRTKLSGDWILIQTPRLLADVAEANGWQVESITRLDAYQRFDVHQKNSIRDESLVLLRRQATI